MAMLKPFPPGPVVRHEGCHTSCLLHGPGGLLTHWQWRVGRLFFFLIRRQAFASIVVDAEGIREVGFIEYAHQHSISWREQFTNTQNHVP